MKKRGTQQPGESRGGGGGGGGGGAVKQQTAKPQNAHQDLVNAALDGDFPAMSSAKHGALNVSSSSNYKTPQQQQQQQQQLKQQQQYEQQQQLQRIEKKASA